MSEKAAKEVVKALGGEFVHYKTEDGHHLVGDEDGDSGFKVTSGPNGGVHTQEVNTGAAGPDYGDLVKHADAAAAAAHIKKQIMGEQRIYESSEAAKAVKKALGRGFVHLKTPDGHLIGHNDDDAWGAKITHNPKNGKFYTHGVNPGSVGPEYDPPVEHDSAEAAAKHLKKQFMGEQRIYETLAADSIKPKGNASKVQAMATAVKAIANMNPENLKNFMATISAPNLGAPIDGGAAAKNAATIAMKPSAASSMKEDLTVVFEGEDLSEEFKDRASALFEAAIEVRVMTEMARLEEEYATALEEQMETFTEELTTKLDSYLDYVVENWMEENQVAIESTLQSEITQEFIEGLRNLFAEHYINVPNDKVDVLEALAEKVEILESKLDEVLVENNELRGALVEEAAKDIIEDVSSGLALTQKDKFVKIAEGIEFDGNLETFESKLKAIKESYFGKSQPSDSNILEEEFDGEVGTSVKNIDPAVGRYVDAIAKNIKK